jgi:hypothetical protein
MTPSIPTFTGPAQPDCARPSPREDALFPSRDGHNPQFFKLQART